MVLTIQILVVIVLVLAAIAALVSRFGKGVVTHVVVLHTEFDGVLVRGPDGRMGVEKLGEFDEWN